MSIQFGAIRLSELQSRLQDGPVTLVDEKGHQISKRVPGGPRTQAWMPTQFTVSQVVQADVRFPQEDEITDWPFVMLHYRDNNGQLGVEVNTQKARRRGDGDYVFLNLDFKA